MALKGEYKNRIEVIGDGIIDAACLTETLRKEVGYADILSVEEVKENVEKNSTVEIEEDTPVCYKQPEFEVYQIVYDSSPRICTIM